MPRHVLKVKSIQHLHGKYYHLSDLNMHYPFEYQGKTWPSIVHCFQAQKVKEGKRREQIREAPFPLKAWQIGRLLPLRKDWKMVRYNLMREIKKAQLEQHPELVTLLLETKDMDILHGVYHHDNLWANCLCHKCKHRKGLNWYGKILMELRKRYRRNAKIKIENKEDTESKKTTKKHALRCKTDTRTSRKTEEVRRIRIRRKK